MLSRQPPPPAAAAAPGVPGRSRAAGRVPHHRAAGPAGRLLRPGHADRRGRVGAGRGVAVLPPGGGPAGARCRRVGRRRRWPGPATSSAGTARAPSTTSRCGRTSSSSSGATAWSPTASTAGCAWSRPTRSARSRSGRRPGRRSAASPTSRAGRWPCSAPARSGCRPTGPRACTTCTSATRPSSTAAGSRSKGAGTRGCARPSTGSPSTATPSPSTIRAGSSRRCGPQLEAVMTKSRRGDVERGFSMTLGRAFDPDDDGLLLAVVHGPAGARRGVLPVRARPPGIDGYSLDLMRRDDGEHPNGLLDFAVVETIRHLKDAGPAGPRASTSPPCGPCWPARRARGLSQRIQAWLLRRMSDSMQIESLWKFNAKYDPDWQPRYALYDSPEHALPAAIAVARAESFWELPVIGRFLVPSDKAGERRLAPLLTASRRMGRRRCRRRSRRRRRLSGRARSRRCGEVGQRPGPRSSRRPCWRSSGPAASHGRPVCWPAAGPARSSPAGRAPDSRRFPHRFATRGQARSMSITRSSNTSW